jgi:hypothetical protein
MEQQDCGVVQLRLEQMQCVGCKPVESDKWEFVARLSGKERHVSRKN